MEENLMKKILMILLATFLAFGTVGTAGAVDYVWQLANANTLDFFASPVTDSGASVYALAGGPIDAALTTSGASLMIIEPTTGVSQFWGGTLATGSSAYGTPVVISGETVFIQVYNAGVGAQGISGTGTSLYAINGATGGTYYTTDLPYYAPRGYNLGFPWNIAAVAGASPWATSLTLDTDGTTIYGTSGVSVSTGTSIWAVSTATGALNSNQYNGAGTASGVSAIWAAPVISGNSLYILGETRLAGEESSGVSLLVFDKRALENGPAALSTTVLEGDTANTPFATPAISGNSLFVMDATGGLTAYNKDTLTRGANDFIQFASVATSAVTASPVTDGNWLVVTANNHVTAQAGVTVFDLSVNPVATGVSWWFVWTGATITATPAISNGVLYVAVNRTSQRGQIDTFRLSGHEGALAAPDFTAITNDVNGNALGFFDYSSPIIKNQRLIILSNGGTGVGAAAAAKTPYLYNFDVSATADGNAWWRQFKFDAARTGHNTAPAAEAAIIAGDSGGCFISTIK